MSEEQKMNRSKHLSNEMDMFSATETKSLATIFLTSVIMLSTAQVWGGGGLITTALAVYAITGALLYIMLTIVNYFVSLAIRKWRERRSNLTS